MEPKLFFIFFMAAMSFFLLAYSSALEQTSVEASCDDFMKLHPEKTIKKEVKITVEETLTVTLCSNATTGFKWELAEITDQAVLKHVDNTFEAPETKGLVGAPGKEVWTFKAMKKGESTISMEYSQPWKGGKKAAWTFSLTVVVE